ncbi:MAG: S8 family serine peptidase [Pseudomonadota bacterium]
MKSPCVLVKLLFLLSVLQFIQSCATTEENLTNFELDNEFKEPLLLVIEDPRGERKRFGAHTSPGYAANVEYNKDPVLQRAAKKIVDDYALVAGQQWPLRSLGVHCIVIETPTPDILVRLKGDRRVKWVQDFNQFNTELREQPQSEDKAPVNDQPIIDPPIMTPNVKLPNRGLGINILIIDTGLNTQLSAFSDTRMQYKDFVSDSEDGQDEIHGTAVTALLGAQGDNADMPMNGMMSDANFMHYRGCWQKSDGKGVCTTLTLALALEAAIEATPDVINLSLSGPADRVLEALVEKLLAQGTIIVSAHDNKRNQNNRFPQPRPGVIYAYGMSDVKPFYISSNTFLASASAVSLSPQGSYDVYSGHSIATPQITAMAASLIGTDPAVNKKSIANRLKAWLTRGPEITF